MLDKSSEQTVSQFRASVTRAVLALDPAGEQERHADAVEQRRVVLTPDLHGMAQLWAYLPADGAATVLTAIDAIASETIFGNGGDSRSADQRRADALVTLADSALADPHLTKRHGARPAVQLTVAATTLLGLDEQPGELAGYGPIPAAMARRIAKDDTGSWRRLLTDDHGRLLDYGSRTYRPPARLAAFIIARDQTCTFASCTRPAVACDLDHLTAAKDGGPTCEGNLHPLVPAASPLQTPHPLATRNDNPTDQPSGPAPPATPTAPNLRRYRQPSRPSRPGLPVRPGQPLIPTHRPSDPARYRKSIETPAAPGRQETTVTLLPTVIQPYSHTIAFAGR